MRPFFFFRVIMKIYIAGPMSGLRDCNRPEFNRVADILTKNGDVVLNPAILPDGLSQADYMAVCIAMLQRCDAILMLNGWQGSEGAKAEHALAKKLGLKLLTLNQPFFP